MMRMSAGLKHLKYQSYSEFFNRFTFELMAFIASLWLSLFQLLRLTVGAQDFAL